MLVARRKVGGDGGEVVVEVADADGGHAPPKSSLFESKPKPSEKEG